MEKRSANALSAAVLIVSLVALPVYAARDSREMREPAVVKLMKFAKRVLGIATTSDWPTVPKP